MFLRQNLGPGGPEVRRNLHQLGESQWWSRSDIEATQVAQLKRLIRYAYERSAFCRRRFDENQIDPHDISFIADLEAIPPLTRQAIRDNADTIAARDFDGEAYVQTSGGSTGDLLQFVIDRSSSWWSAAVQIRGRRYGVVLERSNHLPRVSGLGELIDAASAGQSVPTVDCFGGHRHEATRWGLGSSSGESLTRVREIRDLQGS